MTPIQYAFKFTGWAEGGYTVDNGGQTNFGVTQTTYNEFRTGMKLQARPVIDITPPEVNALQQTMYWFPAHCDILPVRLAVCHFDCAYNSGPTEALRILQRTLRINSNGIYDSVTNQAIMSQLENDTVLAGQYLDLRWKFLQEICIGENPDVRLNGYRNRIDNLRQYLTTIH